MNKLEKGMYVRTEEGKIFKTDGDKLYLSNDKKILYRLLTRIPYDTANYKVIKASYNIIDLIEAGDYVNGLYITEINQKLEYKLIWHLSKYGDDDVAFKEEDIKSIVTKEQFSSMEYRLGDK